MVRLSAIGASKRDCAGWITPEFYGIEIECSSYGTPPKRVLWPNSLLGRNIMKWIATAFAALLLAALTLSIPASIFTTEASANRMNGRGNCSGGVCTDRRPTAQTAVPQTAVHQ